MKKIYFLAAAFFIFNPIYSVHADNPKDEEITQLVKFLVSPSILKPGKYGEEVPLSYYIGTGDEVAIYFGDYICAKNNTCYVKDTVYKNPFAVLGEGLPPQQGTELQKLQAQAQIERTDMKHGADIYDAATWQIALGLAAKYGYLDTKEALRLINNQTKNILHKDNRATNPEFKYGYQNAISKVEQAFTFRMITTNFMNPDPFLEGKYKSSVDSDDSAKKFEGASSWSDWKPILGENAWAQLIGPLQAEYLANNGKISATTLDNAINSLYAFSAMQAGIGAFYYAPGGSEGNQGPIPQGEISLENNFSLLGGLQIFKHILSEMEQTEKIKTAINDINIMLYGGKTVNGYQTIGLLSFLRNGAYNENKNVFYTHGSAKDPSSQNDWEPDNSNDAGANAVDVNTWGISALGVNTIDTWYGKNTALTIWKKVKKQGGFHKNDNELWGVGYTFNNAEENIMSTEWTAGAISAVNSLMDHYGKTTELDNDFRSMSTGINHLRNDQYLQYFKVEEDGATPEKYFTSVPVANGYAYLYASRRFAIPFGWNANTLPSTTSNAWVIMNKLGFNPFQYQGKLSGENYPEPAKLDITGGGSLPIGDALPKDVKINFNADGLGEQNKILTLVVNYKFSETDANWKKGGTATASTKLQGVANLPKNTKIISIAFEKNAKNNWYGSCTVSPATKICKNKDCTEVKTLVAVSTEQGLGACLLR